MTSWLRSLGRLPFAEDLGGSSSRGAASRGQPTDKPLPALLTPGDEPEEDPRVSELRKRFGTVDKPKRRKKKNALVSSRFPTKTVISEGATGKLSPDERRSINADLAAAGFDGAVRFRSIDSALDRIGRIMDKHGVGWGDPDVPVEWHDVQGSAGVYLIRKDTADSADPEVLANSMAFVQWVEMTDGLEVIAHLS
jgi:hypothetical protein